MFCRICKNDKLSREFIPYPITSECRHPNKICLRCAAKAAEIGICPYDGCEEKIDKASYQIREIQLMLDYQFSEVHEDGDLNSSDYFPENHIRLINLTGGSKFYKITSTTLVTQLKSLIETDMQIPKSKQVLLYKGKELQDYNGKNLTRLSDYVKRKSTIMLMVLLYDVPNHLNHVSFDLTWDYPLTGKDFLDASCLVFTKSVFVQYVDFKIGYMGPVLKVLGTGQARGISVRMVKPDYEKCSILHSADYLMDDSAKKGKHTIQVYLKRLPADVDHIFFVLSAWKHPMISHFPNPSLRLYDNSEKSENLCETTFTHALNSQAVILCSLSKRKQKWHVFKSGALSEGNAINYDPMIARIKELISQGTC